MNSSDLNIKINSLPDHLKQQLSDFLDYLLFKTSAKSTTPMVAETQAIYKLNTIEKEAIKSAKKQIKNGQFSTNEEVFNKIDKWLAKK